MAMSSTSGVSVESWVEIEPCTPVDLEVDERNDMATLYFGERRDFVLNLAGQALRDVATLSNRAADELGVR